MSEARKVDRDDERTMVLVSVAELKRVVAEAVREVAPANSQLEFLTASQVADLMNTTTRSVQSWAKNGTLPSLRIGAEYRFKRDDVVAWLAERATTTSAVNGRRKR